MTDKTSDKALTAWAESDAPTIHPGTEIRRGTPEGRAEVVAMLLEAAEDPADVAAIERAADTGGRPSLAATGPTGVSPLWQVRAPRDLDTELRAFAAEHGRTFSDVVREAASEYLTAHKS